jgi:glutamate decarboxylase
MSKRCVGVLSSVSRSSTNMNIKASRDASCFQSTRAAEIEYLQKVSQLCIENVKRYSDTDAKVVEYETPENLGKKFDFSLGSAAVADTESLFGVLDSVMKYSVHTMSPNFYTQLFHWGDCYGVGGDWVSSCLNTGAYTYEMAPVFTLMELEVLDQMRKLLGFPAESDGLVCHGGSQSIFYAMNCLRFLKFPDVLQSGLQGLPNMTVFASEECHYASEKAMGAMGLGLDNFWKIAVDESGAMIPSALEKSITESKSKGSVPLLVIATAGSTTIDSYDDIDALADVCEKHNVLLLVDAAFGGPLAFSRTHSHRLNGISRADAVAFDFHKILGAPSLTSVVLLKEPKLLSRCHKASAGYLFAPDKHYDTAYDVGDRSLQCGRKPDSFKIWMAWKARGSSGFENHVDTLYELSNYLCDALRNHPNFELAFPEMDNRLKVNFWYMPDFVREIEDPKLQKEVLGKCTSFIKKQLVFNGKLYITAQPYRDYAQFFRINLVDARRTGEDLDRIITEIENVGKLLKLKNTEITAQ